MQKKIRIVLCAFALIIQAMLIVFLISFCCTRFELFRVLFFIIGIFAAADVLNGGSEPTYKIAWLIPLLIATRYVGIIYFLFGKRKRKRMNEKNTIEGTKEQLPFHVKRQSDYIYRTSGLPLHINTTTRFFSLGEDKYTSMLRELKKAKKFIFLEYFIIQRGKMWDSILEILVQKAKEGVEVRVIYDEFGCLFTLPANYEKTLERQNIKCRVFNPLKPILSMKLNNRDHRKICVIDGHTGFLGGINLADEYINEIEKHGHWKDSSIMLKGDAVQNLTSMFLEMWNYGEKTYEKVSDFTGKMSVKSDGFVQPFADDPLTESSFGENVYINIINRAEKYIYITTPYIMISRQLNCALCSAANSGIDVRIVTPHIADKKFVHCVTRSYYRELIDNDVKIYEYVPGFIHSKNVVADDEVAIVGSINFDYRSLYLHYESAVWLYKTESVTDIRDDFISTLDKCKRITAEMLDNEKWYIKAIRYFLRFFAPFM